MSSASLPMYDIPEVREATDAWWDGLRGHLLRAGIADVPRELLRRDDLLEQWSDPQLLLSQTCGYLLTHQLRGSAQAVATPHYRVPGCDGPRYSSVILKRAGHPGATPADFRGAVAVYSRAYSHAGYNSFRGLIAPLAGGRPFFSRVVGSGSHAESIEMLKHGAADLATIDCLVYAFVSLYRPAALEGTQAIGHTPLAPAAPYIVPLGMPRERVARVCDALVSAVQDRSLAAVRQTLFIDEFSFASAPDYDDIDAVERAAATLSYPELA